MNLAQNQSSELPFSPDKQNAKNSAMSTQTNISLENSETPSNQERQLPIPAPSHPRQYRAIGLIKAQYKVTAD